LNIGIDIFFDRELSEPLSVSHRDGAATRSDQNESIGMAILLLFSGAAAAGQDHAAEPKQGNGSSFHD
jgi:hypothetical protein